MSPDQPSTSASAPPAPQKPRGLSAVVGLTMAVAILGLFTGLTGLGSLVFAKNLPAPFKMMRVQPPSEQMRRLADVQARMLEAGRLAPAIPLYVAVFPMATWLLVSVRRVSRRQRGALPGLERAVLAFALLELGFLALQIAIQLRVRPLMAEMMEVAATGSSAPMAAGVSRMMGTFMEGAVIVGLVFGVLWSLAKIGLCLYARSYARKPEVRAWVDGAAAI
jgi:predicted secreted protein